jgi:hypothetical protein
LGRNLENNGLIALQVYEMGMPNTLFLVMLLGHYSISREVSLWDFGRNEVKEKSQRVAERLSTQALTAIGKIG